MQIELNLLKFKIGSKVIELTYNEALQLQSELNKSLTFYKLKTSSENLPIVPQFNKIEYKEPVKVWCEDASKTK